MTKDGYLNPSPPKKLGTPVKDDRADEKEFKSMNEIYFVLCLCALYSSVVVYSLWITVQDRAKVKVSSKYLR
jgi:hypothetical protein